MNNNIDKNKITNENDITRSVNITIDEKEYTINLENNETVKSFVNLLPLSLTLNELNGNEKYIYLQDSLISNPTSINHISAGDVMLYGDNCLVIFYKSFDTSYRYTKIGHIDNLPILDNDSIEVEIRK